MDGRNHERDLGSYETRNEVSALGNLRPYWTRRALVLLVAFLLVTTFLPGRALAAGQYYPGQEVIVDGMVAGDGDVGYMCIAYTNFNAALVALGVSVSDARLTDDARAKLSNAATGGDFYLFADSFHTRTQLYGNLPLWADDPMLQAYVSQWENIAGSGPIGPYQDIFYATVSPDLVGSAKRDLQTILDGGDLGGGGSGGDDGDYLTFFGNPVYVNKSVGRNPYFVNTQGVRYSNNVQSTYSLLPTQITVRIKGDRLTSFLENYKVTDYRYFIYIKNTNANNNLGIVNIYALDKSVTTTEKQNTVGNVGSTYIDSVSKLVGHVFSSTNLTYTYTDNVITVDLPDNVGSISTSNVGGFTSDGQLFLERGNGVAGPVIPPSNWPSTPEVTAPTAPEVPEPSEPEIPSQPVQPSAPTLPDFPSNVIAPGTTYETFDIQAILDAMDEHCRHLQSAIYTGFSDYFDTFTPWLSQELETVRACIRGESQWQMDVLHTELDDLQDYLWQLAQWLAARMQFDVGGGGYDDTSVVSWLKRIYFKLGGGSVSTRPIDPVVDPGGISDWLDKLFQQLIDALFGVGANVLAQLLEKLQALEEKFPFCIPWDIGAILALMVATPEAPAFDLPCYSLTSEGVQQVGVYEIDLSVFDDYMGPIRSMQTILFAAFLCFKVDWFKSALKMEGLS